MGELVTPVVIKQDNEPPFEAPTPDPPKIDPPKAVIESKLRMAGPTKAEFAVVRYPVWEASGIEGAALGAKLGLTLGDIEGAMVGGIGVTK